MQRGKKTSDSVVFFWRKNVFVLQKGRFRYEYESSRIRLYSADGKRAGIG